MTTRNLQYLFAPQSVAVIGASGRSGSVGAAVTRNLLEGGFQGALRLVNPKHDRVGDHPCYPDVGSLDIVPQLDALLFIHAPTAIVDSHAIALACAPLLRVFPAPVFSCWLGGNAVARARQGELVAEVRAVSDPGNQSAEFAVLVRPDWSETGLDRVLLSRLITYCRQRGTQQLCGNVLPDHQRMLDLAAALGFRILPGAGKVARIELDLGEAAAAETQGKEERGKRKGERGKVKGERGKVKGKS